MITPYPSLSHLGERVSGPKTECAWAHYKPPFDIDSSAKGDNSNLISPCSRLDAHNGR